MVIALALLAGDASSAQPQGAGAVWDAPPDRVAERVRELERAVRERRERLLELVSMPRAAAKGGKR